MMQAKKDLRSAPGGDFEWACLCEYFEEEECIGIPAARPLEALRAFAADVRSRLRVDRIILFGSAARGSLHEGSDIDLIVIGDFSERFHRRIAALLDLTDLPVEPLCYTPAEFERLVEEKNPFILQALFEGVDL